MAAVSMSGRRALYNWRIYLYVLPSLALILTFCYFPAISAVVHSFFEWQGGDYMQFVRFDNYTTAFNDTVLKNSFATISVLIIASIVKMAPSILLAVLIHRLASDQWQYWYRVLLIVPMVVPDLVNIFIWKFFFDPNLGLINASFDLFGVKSALVWFDQNFLHWSTFRPDSPISWLNEPKLIIPSLIFWGFPWIGAMSVYIFLAGLQSIGTEVYEAAELDGASSWQKFTKIEFPLIMTQVRLNVILIVIGTLQGYGLIYLLLGPAGGPAGRGMVPGLWMFNRAFIAGQFGYACAIGMILFVIIAALTYFNNKYIRVEK